MSPVRAPLRSSSELVAVVVPWTMTATSAALAAAPASAPWTPPAWLATVVGTLATRTRPVASSTSTRSVKVPPTSTPTSLASGTIALVVIIGIARARIPSVADHREQEAQGHDCRGDQEDDQPDRKSTRLNSSHI